MMIQLYNSMTKKNEHWNPNDSNPKVKIYSCGPTVYDSAHIGNFSTFLFNDLLKRTLGYFGYMVIDVVNITDIDDKIIKRSQESGISPKELTDKYTEKFLSDCDKLNIQRPKHTPRATDCIPEMIDMIQTLIDKEFAYKVESGVYFRVHKSEGNKFPGVDLRTTELAEDQPMTDKENPEDFALWKAWKESDGDVFWDSSFGKGRPGWHIECSAMARKYLGDSFHIHTGGIDLQFPHHQNEITQSEAATGKTFCSHWMHKAFLNIGEEKASKSLGNIYTIDDLETNGYRPDEFRYAIISTHYRTPLEFSFQTLEEARKNLSYFKELFRKLRNFDEKKDSYPCAVDYSVRVDLHEEEMKKALFMDLNASKAIGVLFEVAKRTNSLIDKKALKKNQAEEILSFFLKVDEIFGIFYLINRDLKEEVNIPKKVMFFVKKRELARKGKDWEESDRLREKIRSLGFQVKDNPDGTMEITS